MFIVILESRKLDILTAEFKYCNPVHCIVMLLTDRGKCDKANRMLLNNNDVAFWKYYEMLPLWNDTSLSSMQQISLKNKRYVQISCVDVSKKSIGYLFVFGLKKNSTIVLVNILICDSTYK